ncbi:MAG TPA: outer membrane lipid asymmetry maintenance protein MlaD [Syntrophales bacterium]|jgi:phospholipid/cholesterol/gamma-HCH transport system substrate-binding protein|nr:outer membrane lipid asymmetry maintenance protein MlaD [Syntrophales bacterium]HON23106.1 outer membrane lipid asymmetry maintenance protein MlaD [Syntrophales bacterium]HOU77454.1 outer membrane lipid asymmetry maintenance protein MlaD [Syntrophales bacterium]HPC31792.1 outer membrane lipid asymmetry maintenance protein MlaD [Syntrophales bacterium]HQG33517.1 outer membrane lipid asymmetry maintenance protein MlaD [Syntrophales bacterium]
MQRYKLETAVGIFLVLGLIVIGYMTVKLGHVSLFGNDTYPLYARFTSVTGLRTGSLVYIAGIEVGRVERLYMDQENQQAVVEMRIKKEIRIYDDAIASIKTEGLIGDMHLRIDPGGGGTLLKAGGVITDTQPPLDIGELIGKYAFGDVKKQEQKNTEQGKP